MNKNKLSTICDEFHKKVYALNTLGKDPQTELFSFAGTSWCKRTTKWSLIYDLPAFLWFLQQQTNLFGTLRKSEEPTRSWTPSGWAEPMANRPQNVIFFKL
ncbi:hypothetical protein T4B_6623 [Trichinella pseudospiralis]|uniref:Uncharacterized protein n=1 Tax=Trichinella pseudospiralis TaxID=6337 RepID=A0A0V1IW47_TRIPS|nr:hypothetical protein T4B_6623 [Trichinella pseudospiralis]